MTFHRQSRDYRFGQGRRSHAIPIAMFRNFYKNAFIDLAHDAIIATPPAKRRHFLYGMRKPHIHSASLLAVELHHSATY